MEPLYSFKNQFTYSPEIINDKHKDYKSFVVVGMGGSAIAVNLLKMMFPDLHISLHNDYGAPTVKEKRDTLVIFNSYSGNTEEVMDSLSKSIELGYKVACISTGGKLIKIATQENIPHIILPSVGIEPRFSIGYQMLALLEIMRQFVAKEKLSQEAMTISTDMAEQKGKALANFVSTRSIVLYSSAKNYPICYATKAAINEGAKHPAFSNIFSEANHNELEAFSAISDSQKSEYIFVLVHDEADNGRIQKRMQIINDLYVEKGLSPYILHLKTASIPEILESLLTGYFLATHLAMNKQVDPYKTPTIAEFKSRMAN
jgi:glucose/mannose-6-phosphate isomerase